MKKLSEIIKTDCYIDCGSNEKLREVMKILSKKIKTEFYIDSDDVYVRLFRFKFNPFSLSTTLATRPIHHISEIDLNN